MNSLGYMTVPEMLETMHENDLFDMFRVFSNVVHILGVVPACVLQNDHSVRCADWKLTSTAPWGNNESVKSSVTWSYHWYLQPSKWQIQLFLLMCFMSSCDTFICKNIFTSYLGLCWCFLRSSFLFYCFVKFGQLATSFWACGLLPPSHLAKNCPYAYLLTVSTAFVLNPQRKQH